MTVGPSEISPIGPETIVITGAAGEIATLIIPRLRRPGRTLKLIDIAPIHLPDQAPDIQVQAGSVNNLEMLTQFMAGARAVVHLAGQSHETDFDDIVRSNIYGTYCVLEAARRTGIGRIILASSNHAAGFHDISQSGAACLPADIPARPDSFYGWSKASCEALAQLYADRYGAAVVSLRIGKCVVRPSSQRELAIWLSPDDAARLVEACISAPQSGHRVVWGVSNNTRRFMSLKEGRALGYWPQDNAETHESHIAADINLEGIKYPQTGKIGGPWCSTP